MTIQSAASTLGDSWNRRLSLFMPPENPRPLQRRASLPPLKAASPLPPRRLRAGVAKDEPPRAKILVIEDQAVVALDLQRTLREAGYHIVGPAATLADIQRLIGQGPIDCAILDIDVNRRTPLPVADLLAFAEIPFVFLTGGERVDLLQQHAHWPVVEKPYGEAALIAAIERAITRHATPTVPLQAEVPVWPRVFPSL